jgi:di/tricarboxylate transporter
VRFVVVPEKKRVDWLPLTVAAMLTLPLSAPTLHPTWLSKYELAGTAAQRRVQVRGPDHDRVPLLQLVLMLPVEVPMESVTVADPP